MLPTAPARRPSPLVPRSAASRWTLARTGIIAPARVEPDLLIHGMMTADFDSCRDTEILDEIRGHAQRDEARGTRQSSIIIHSSDWHS